MTKSLAPQVGFNTNVRHKNRVFHLQTEDSGMARPHITTHLFMDGGRILKSEKRSYAEYVGAPDCAATVRQLMKEQHRAMFIRLREGAFDALVDEGSPKPPDASARESGRAGAASTPSVRPGSPPSGRPLAVGSELPPPPGALFNKERATGQYSHVAGRDSAGSIAPPRARSSRPKRTSDPPRNGSQRPAESRYARARPAAVFEDKRPEHELPALFDTSLADERALDEAIVAYLIDD